MKYYYIYDSFHLSHFGYIDGNMRMQRYFYAPVFCVNNTYKREKLRRKYFSNFILLSPQVYNYISYKVFE